MTKAKAKKQLETLVKYYKNNSTVFEDFKYNEAQARSDFINVFFELLNWKITGLTSNISLENRDVLVEHSLKSGTTKSVDYIFNIKNKLQFIVEAKKPSESLANSKHIFQAKTYGFLSKIPFVILTNFKEFKIFDISTKPNFNQTNEDLIFSCTYEEYIKNFDYIWNNFSKEAVQEKSLVKLFTERRKELQIDLTSTDYSYILKKGEQLLDNVFLNDLNIIRLELAQNIIKNTKTSISDKKLNDVTQRLLDIIIFIRFLEDNEIENVELLRLIIDDKEDCLKRFIEECSQLNSKYNGQLFHIYPDFQTIKVDPINFKKSILRLYYPESPYNFSKISIEILGQIFEQYLAKKITVLEGVATLQLKPEIKKAGGIYFTPEYIVDYILDNTLKPKLSKAVPNKQLKQIKAIDFSLGSGIFLIKIFKRLIEYFEQQSSGINSKYLFQDSLGNVKLTMAAKKIILSNNIFGIDIDPHAIEITKMSLYFTMLENYCEDDSPRPILPSLQKNIICGNSIIAPNFFDDETNIDIQTIDIVNPISWREHDLDSFDLVVGNPPYLRIQLLEELYPKNYQNYLKEIYTFPHSNFDLSIVFVEKGISLLKQNGQIGYILPNTVLTAKYGENFRARISKDKLLSKIVHFNDCQVFQDSTTYTCLLFLEKTAKQEMEFLSVTNIENDFLGKKDFKYSKHKLNEFSSEPWFFSASKIQNTFFSSLDSNSIPLKQLENLKKIFVGLQPSLNDVFLLEKVSENSKTITCHSEATGNTHQFEKSLLKKMVKGSSNIFRYRIETNRMLLFPYTNNKLKNTSELITPKILRSKYPLTWKYLLLCKKKLQKKESLKSHDFYKFIYKKNHLLFENKKIVLPSLCYGSRFALDDKGELFFTGSGEGGGGGYGLLLNNSKSSYDYYNILGILNSSLISAIIELKGKYKQGGYKGIDRTFIQNIPIPKITTKKQKEILKKISLKTRALNLITTKNPSSAVLKIISRTEAKINDLVLEVYNIKDQNIIKLINEVND